MTIDLSALSLIELQKLQADVDAEIPKRRTAERHAVAAQLHQIARDAGFTLQELLGSVAKPGKEKQTRGPAKVKYQLKGDTWTGRGRKPAWLVDYLAMGGNLENLRVG